VVPSNLGTANDGDVVVRTRFTSVRSLTASPSGDRRGESALSGHPDPEADGSTSTCLITALRSVRCDVPHEALVNSYEPRHSYAGSASGRPLSSDVDQMVGMLRVEVKIAPTVRSDASPAHGLCWKRFQRYSTCLRQQCRTQAVRRRQRACALPSREEELREGPTSFVYRRCPWPWQRTACWRVVRGVTVPTLIAGGRYHLPATSAPPVAGLAPTEPRRCPRRQPVPTLDREDAAA
jgi:hypothetical protein